MAPPAPEPKPKVYRSTSPPPDVNAMPKLEDGNGGYIGSGGDISVKDANLQGTGKKYAYSEDDIRKCVGNNVPILRYPELQKYHTPEELFAKSDAVVLLFLTESKDIGHWLVVLNRPEHYEVFDSFGVGKVMLFLNGRVFRSEVEV
jgi:hypothetical protein